MVDEDDDWEDDDEEEDDDEFDEDDELEEARQADLVKEEEMRAIQQRQEIARAEAEALKRRTAREDVYVDITAVLGTAEVVVNNLLKVGRGAVIELNSSVDDLIEIRANGKTVAEAEVVVNRDQLAVSVVQLYKK